MKKGSIIFFRRKTLVSQSRIKLWASLKCFKQIVEPERFMYNRGYHVFISKFLGRKVPKKFVRVGDPSIFRKFGVIEIIYKQKRVSGFFVQIFLSDLAENFCKRKLLFLRDFLVSKSFYGWKRGVSHFSVKKHRSHRAEKFREHPCNVSEKPWYRKFLCIRGGITFLCQNFFVSHCRNFLQINPNVSDRISCFEKILRKENLGIKFFCRETLVSQSRKVSWASLQYFRKFGVIDITYA